MRHIVPKLGKFCVLEFWPISFIIVGLLDVSIVRYFEQKTMIRLSVVLPSSD
jgi:hypothetical protein